MGFWPTAEQLAQGFIAAARAVGEDPLQAYAETEGRRTRAVLYQALRELRPDIRISELGRLCGLGSFARERVKEARKAAWWSLSGEAAAKLAGEAMAAAGLVAVARAGGLPAKLLQALAEGEASRSMLRVRLRWGYTPGQIGAALDALVGTGQVACGPKPRGARGKPATMYWLAGDGAQSQDPPPESAAPGGRGTAREASGGGGTGRAPASPPVAASAYPQPDPDAPAQAPSTTPQGARSPSPPLGDAESGGGSKDPDQSQALASPRCADRHGSDITARMRDGGGVEAAEAASKSRQGGAASSAVSEEAVNPGKPAPSREPVGLRAELLQQLARKPQTALQLYQALGRRWPVEELREVLRRMHSGGEVAVARKPHDYRPNDPAYRLDIAALERLDPVMAAFRPRPVGGTVGYMDPAAMPDAAPLVSPSCRSGSRTVGKPAKTGRPDPLAALKLDPSAMAEVQDKVRRRVPWPHIARQTGKNEHTLRLAFDAAYRAAHADV